MRPGRVGMFVDTAPPFLVGGVLKFDCKRHTTDRQEGLD
ncbi:Uncharacterised protein [Mycobacteroides abscessus subsp. massiliense]|nr:Uncharacterised protein [Mycobacteroides abscessus subsp. massiliense]